LQKTSVSSRVSWTIEGEAWHAHGTRMAHAWHTRHGMCTTASPAAGS
jgi:hypothetical protein